MLDQIRHTPPSDLQRPAPPVEQFVLFPAAWYLFGTTREIARGPVSKAMLGRQLVAYRTDSGQLVVMDARCSHLGADLGRGCVVGEAIQCPFHHWQYGADGRCTQIPNSQEMPLSARQRCYPAVERHGLVFFFNGEEPLFPLPFFFGERVEDYRAASPAPFVANCTWYMVAAHGFDRQHFASVHGRQLFTPLEIDCPSPYARRSRYQAEVVGDSLYDRLLRVLVGRTVEISITTWAGTLVLITGSFRRAESRFLIATQPIADGKTRCEVVVFCRRGGFAGTMVAPLSLAMRRWFTKGYLVDEVNSLGHPIYNPSGLIAADQEMIEYFHWAAALP